MSDYLTKMLGFNKQVRIYVTQTTNMLEEMCELNGATPVVRAAFGRTVSVAAMMGGMLKGSERLNVRVEGDGPIGKIVVDAHADGKIRGYVSNPIVELPLNGGGKLDVRGAVGTQGLIYVIKDIGLKDYFTGQTEIISGELGEDFAYYFTVSEQIPTAVSVGVLVDTDWSIKASGGLIVQVLPGTDEAVLDQLEASLAKLPPISGLLADGKSAEEIVAMICDDFEVLETQEIYFECGCSRERFETALMSIGKDELDDMINDGETIETVCNFCHKKYYFSVDELKDLKNRIEK